MYGQHPGQHNKNVTIHTWLIDMEGTKDNSIGPLLSINCLQITFLKCS